MTDPKREDAYCAEIRRAVMEIYNLKFYDIMITEGTTRAGNVKRMLYDEHSNDQVLMEEGYKAALRDYYKLTPADDNVYKSKIIAFELKNRAAKDEEDRERRSGKGGNA